MQIPIPDEENTKFNYDLHRQHILFCGTQVLQGKAQKGNYIKGVVIRTGTPTEFPAAYFFPIRFFFSEEGTQNMKVSKFLIAFFQGS